MTVVSGEARSYIYSAKPLRNVRVALSFYITCTVRFSQRNRSDGRAPHDQEVGLVATYSMVVPGHAVDRMIRISPTTGSSDHLPFGKWRSACGIERHLKDQVKQLSTDASGRCYDIYLDKLLYYEYMYNQETNALLT